MSYKYIPTKGDIVWLDFNPQAGHEHSGNRPALVLSPKEYNKKVGLALFCPITSQIKNYPFEVLIPNYLKINGVILCDQIKSLDWKIRNAKLICKLPIDYIYDVIEKIKVLIY